MAVNHVFITRRILSQESLTSLNSTITHHPYMDFTQDGVRKLYLGSDTNQLKDLGDSLLQAGYQVNGMSITKNLYRRFFVDANTLGFTHVQYTDHSGKYLLELKEILDFATEIALIPDDQKPFINPELQACFLEYSQELGRYHNASDNKKVLASLDGKLTSAMQKATVMLPVHAKDEKGPLTLDNFTVINVVDSAEAKWIPVCLDFMEFGTFVGKQNLQGLRIPADRLAALLAEDTSVKGVLFNPLGVGFKASREVLAKVFPEA